MQRFQDIISQLNWVAEIGRVDIILYTLLIKSYLAMPCIEYLEQAFHIFGYMKLQPRRKLVFHPEHSAINDKFVFRIVTGWSFIGILVNKYQEKRQQQKVIARRHTAFWMKTMLGTPG